MNITRLHVQCNVKLVGCVIDQSMHVMTYVHMINNNIICTMLHMHILFIPYMSCLAYWSLLFVAKIIKEVHKHMYLHVHIFCKVLCVDLMFWFIIHFGIVLIFVVLIIKFITLNYDNFYSHMHVYACLYTFLHTYYIISIYIYN